ncbi:MAG: twin-arginine translocase TatA/TatE family subunit [bacterium]|nr:twin-arginine translocase TatA/TatE family subunit [bacterium]
MFGIGMSELIIILVIALLIFGPKNLPNIGKALGRGIREFKKASSELKEELEVVEKKCDEDIKEGQEKG